MATVVKYNAKKRTYTGTNENDVLDASLLGYEPIGKTNIKKNRGLTITGGNGDDEITGTDYNDTIKGGNGSDTITGGLGADTITGGAGKNIIVVKNTEFGNDVINLTKNEELVIDLTDCTDITDLSDLRYSIIGKNLIITVPEDDEYNKGTITLKNYTKNILKSLSFKLYAQDTIIYNNLTEFTNDVVFNYNNSNLSKKRVLTGSAYNDKIDVENTTTKKYTINAGNGKNDITISSGTNVINSGKDNDTINISLDGNYTVNAGAGENTINIDNSDEFGTVIINEQKVNATNKIVFSNTLSNPKYQKIGNDLYITDDNGKVIIKSYYANVKNKSVLNINGQTIETYMYNKTTDIKGSGKIYGTNNDDNITISGKKAVTIYAGKGNDTIGYSKGNRTFYLYEGDGDDVVEAGDGKDILKFQVGTEVIISAEQNNENINLNVYYGTKGDSITFLNYSKTKELTYYIGNKKYCVCNPNIDINGLINIDNTTINKKGSIIQYMTGSNNKDILINYGTASYINGNDQNDIIINKGKGSRIQGGNGDDIITSYGGIPYIYGEDGDDEISIKGSSIMELRGGNGNDKITIASGIGGINDIYGDSGNDEINIYETVMRVSAANGDDVVTVYEDGRIRDYVDSGSGNDKITINGVVTGYGSNTPYITGGSENDTITNNGTIIGIFRGGNGNDIITNNGIIDGYIHGDEGNDIITNNGTVDGALRGGAGNDIIINNGIVSSTIHGDEGNDTIITKVGSSADNIWFKADDGDDILYLNASVNNLHIFNYAGDFVSINNLMINWNNDDLVISYNNSKDSVTIKDYNPLNSNVKINVNNKNLTTLIPEKPATLMMMSASNMNINEISEQVASFKNTNSDMSLNYNDLQNISDTSSLIAEYTPEQPQVM